MKTDEKSMKTYENQWKSIKNDEEAMIFDGKNKENQCKSIKTNENQLKTIENHGKTLKIDKNK